MRVVALDIYGFRGIAIARLVLPSQAAIVGPNGSGKSTIIDALSLVFGRHELVHDLTEHDFFGSRPEAQSRIRIVATLGGFPSKKIRDFPQWFSQHRGVPKQWDFDAFKAVPISTTVQGELCVQVGFAARFDRDDLAVEQVRYFHDDDDAVDPFMEDAVRLFPRRLLSEIGFFVLPARRTWPGTLSFGSELFRKAISTLGGVPADTVQQHLESLRNPESPLESDPQIKPLIDRLDARMSQLVSGDPRLYLRLTSTDSDSFLRAVVPHYGRFDEAPLPAGRHGTGLVSLQSLILLLEIGRHRREHHESFILALEEPELHVPPGLQRRLIGEAASESDQILCTTHSPRVAAFFDARSILLLASTTPPTPVSTTPSPAQPPPSIETASEGNAASVAEADSGGTPKKQAAKTVEARPLAPASMMGAPNALVQLYTDHRAALVEALMSPVVLVPEGRIDHGWLRLLVDVVETGARSGGVHAPSLPPFGAVVGVVPTRDSHVRLTCERLVELHDHVVALVDGDSAGDGSVRELTKASSRVKAVIQWPVGWSIEDAVRWCIAAEASSILTNIEKRLELKFGTLDQLVIDLKNGNGSTGGLKQHYIAHEEIAGAMKLSPACVARSEILLDAVVFASLNKFGDHKHIEASPNRFGSATRVCRFRP